MEKSQNTSYGRTSPEHLPQTTARTSSLSSRDLLELREQDRNYLDLTDGTTQGKSWETRFPLLGESLTHNGGAFPSVARESSLSEVLTTNVPEKYYLSPRACLGILRRASERGKDLPPILEKALKEIAGGMSWNGEDVSPTLTRNNAGGSQRMPDKDNFNAVLTLKMRSGKDGGGKGALIQNNKSATLATGNDQTLFIPQAIDVKHSSLGDKAATLGVNCGMPTGRNGVLCLNDQGGEIMSVTEDVTATLRAQEHGHPPLIVGGGDR